MANVIIFGVQDFAQLAHYYLCNDSEHEVMCFVVHEAYLPEDRIFCGLPVFAFEGIEKQFNPMHYSFFAPMSPSGMNLNREKIYLDIKAKGYSFISYISTKATLNNNQIGDNCFILEDNTLQPFTNIGNNVILWSGNHIGHHGVIRDHVFFSSQVVLSGHCTVESYCFFGVNSTIRDGLIIAEGTFVAMDTSIGKNTEAWSVYRGTPSVKAKIPSKSLKF